MSEPVLIKTDIHDETGWEIQTWQFDDGDTYKIYVDNDGGEHDSPPQFEHDEYDDR